MYEDCDDLMVQVDRLEKALPDVNVGKLLQNDASIVSSVNVAKAVQNMMTLYELGFKRERVPSMLGGVSETFIGRDGLVRERQDTTRHGENPIDFPGRNRRGVFIRHRRRAELVVGAGGFRDFQSRGESGYRRVAHERPR